MKTFPMFLCVADRPVIIVGGGEQASQKCRLMLKTEAKITLAWPTLEPDLRALVDAGKISWHRGAVTKDLFVGAALVFIATGCPGSGAALQGLAKLAGTVVNVVDQPALCTAITPAIVDRDPVVVAIGTEGTAPVLARNIKTQIETMLDPKLGPLAALAGQLRGAVARQIQPQNRRAFWQWVFHPKNAHTAAKRVRQVAAGCLPEQPQQGGLCLITARAGAPDLLTLRAVKRLQDADVIYHDKAIDPALLELARRDAARVCLRDHQASSAIIAGVRAGKTVVWLRQMFPVGCADALQTALKKTNAVVEVMPGFSPSLPRPTPVIRRGYENRNSSSLLTLSRNRAAATGSVRPRR